MIKSPADSLSIDTIEDDVTQTLLSFNNNCSPNNTDSHNILASQQLLMHMMVLKSQKHKKNQLIYF